jgi:large repetitive protein
VRAFMRNYAALLFCLLVGVVACGDNGKATPDATTTQCSDNVDNDGDGMVDFPADLGCDDASDDSEDSTPKPLCNDGRDNDGDGKTDFPNDPGCGSPLFDSEDDDCPNGASCPQCADGIDNDGSGKTDFAGMDPGCESAGDNSEFTDNPNACGVGVTIKPLPLTNEDTGTLAATSISNIASPCGPAGAPAIAYVFHLSSPKVVVASTDDPVTVIDTIVDIRSIMCESTSSEMACNDDVSGTNQRSKVTKALNPGTYYLLVSTRNPTGGAYKLTVQFQPGTGAPCNTPADCGAGLECRIPTGGTTKQCIGPVCDDAIDDDGDGKIDYPLDPGCASPTDATENDVCNTTPLDPACPKCANGIDDDMDTKIDYPNDPTCIAASTLNESCPQSEAIIIASGPTTSSTTTGATNDYTPPPGSFNGHTCGTTGTHSAPDVAVQLDVPQLKSLALRLGPTPPSTTLYDSVHILFDSTCGGTPIECYDNPTLMVVNNLAAGRYFLVVDGWSTGNGPFTLTTSGVIANGQSCESPLATSGALTCDIGFACLGAVGSRTCMPTECNDGIDNNTNGKMDYPADPGCASPSDPSENTVCPGASCPVCSDGLDNDGDLLIDYPADTGCLSAAGTNEGCAESDPVLAINATQTTGTLVGSVDDHNPACVTTNFPDRVYTIDIPTSLQSLRIDTAGSNADTVLSFMNNTCAEPSIACDNDGAGSGDSLITRTNVPPGSYTIAIDSNVAALDTFVLNVKGVINPGGSCEGPLFAGGIIECPLNFGCNGPAGSKTCTAAQCLDGVDNNGDGKIDFPIDPGCTSPSDNSESNVCPGASCPLCGDGIDNDSDGQTDYPADPGCTSASGNVEGCFDTDAIAAITGPVTNGTTVGAANDHQPTCVAGVGPEKIHTLTIPNLQSLSLDTEGSVVDTVLSFMDSNCNTSSSLACDDDGGVGTGDSLIQRAFVPAGTYTVAVDALSATTGTYILNVKGVVLPGNSCESPLFAAGALTCSTGFACAGPAGSKTCVVAQCLDGIDNNADGKTDFPNDPGCTSFSDDTETTVCPGANCPVCGDGLDNDADGQTDYPADTSCFAASAMNEACNQSEAVNVITTTVTTGTTAGTSNDYVPTCGSSTHTAADVALQLNLPATMATLNLNLDNSSFDFAHSLLNSTCGGTPIACSDGALMARTNVAAGTYYVVIDGWSGASGPFSLTTTGTIAPGGSCESPLVTAGAFTCTSGNVCAGPTGAKTCIPALCNDTIDNDGDGKTDYPNDPGCATADDNTETDSCPGAGCPACGNGMDDDADTLIDFPLDTRCPAASFYAENACTPEALPDLKGLITGPTTAGTLAAPAAANYSQSCQGSTGNDVTYGLDLPVPVATLVIDTLGSTVGDTVISVWNIACSGANLGCDDDGAPGTDNRSLLTLTNVAAGQYSIQVDGFSSSNNGGFLLNVKGTVATGTACTSPMFAAGILACPAGNTCTAGTCQP